MQQDIAHSLVTDRIPQIGQGTYNAIIAPRAILVRHTHHQGLQLVVDRGTARSLTLLGAIKLLGDQCAVPAENGVGLDDLGHFLQGLLAQLLADLGQGLALIAATTLEGNHTLVTSNLRHFRFIAGLRLEQAPYRLPQPDPAP